MRHLHKIWFLLFFWLIVPAQASDDEVHLAIGLMSGTSMDGIDASLLETDGKLQIREVGSASLSYSRPFTYALKTAEILIKECGADVERMRRCGFAFEMHAKFTWLDDIQTLIQDLEKELKDDLSYDSVVSHSTALHARLVHELLTKTGHTANDIKVIGYHGQTLWHVPQQFSFQAGDGQLLADLTQIPVINNFRENDVKAGGQGAPFAPLYHQALAVRDGMIPCAVVNCGGIANITLIYGPAHEDIVGFDTGPGNGLIDAYVRRVTGGKELMDKDGERGLRGRVNPKLLELMCVNAIMISDYLNLPPPKSLDSRHLILIPELDQGEIDDNCATIEAFTAYTIVKSLELIKDRPIALFWVLGGGGWKNPVITRELQKRLGQVIIVRTADERGWNNQSLEAQIFAWMAVRSLKGLPLSVPQTTGVPEPMCGGDLYIPNSRIK